MHGNLPWSVLAVSAGNVCILVCIHFGTICCVHHNLINKQQATYAALYVYNTGIPGCHCCLTSAFNTVLPCRACQDMTLSPRSPRACTMTTWANAATWSSLDQYCKQPLRHVQASVHFHSCLSGSNSRPACPYNCSVVLQKNIAYDVPTSLIDWISDTLPKGHTTLQSLVNCLVHRGIASDTVCSQAGLC